MIQGHTGDVDGGRFFGVAGDRGRSLVFTGRSHRLLREAPKMRYEVLGPLFRCSDSHQRHSRLEDAVACLADVTRHYEGNIPVHPVSQQHIFEIAAINRHGNQRDFSDREKEKSRTLQVDPKSLATEVPGITNFYRLAEVYCEALRLCPIKDIRLDGIFEHENRDKHFWSTDAGIGQALAYAQQALFTLELSLKAYLEVLGKLADSAPEARQLWHTHEPDLLFNLLTDDEKIELEQQWSNSRAAANHSFGTFQEFLSACNSLYGKWRYITDLKTADISIDIPMLLSASDFLLAESLRIFKDRFPLKIEISVTTHKASAVPCDEPVAPSVDTRVEGVVRDVIIPEGFNPSDLVHLVIDSSWHPEEIMVPFRRSDVRKYYGLTGTKVCILGEISEKNPHLLDRPVYIEEPERHLEYTFQSLTLQGSVHDMRVIHSAFGGAEKVHLVLLDDTFFSQVECFFVTEDERSRLEGIGLGDKIQLSGHVTSQYGYPIVLVGPDRIEIVSSSYDSRNDTKLGISK